jgi:hypothetical protein
MLRGAGARGAGAWIAFVALWVIVTIFARFERRTCSSTTRMR